MSKFTQWAMVVAIAVAGNSMAEEAKAANELKVGYVNTQRLFRDAPVVTQPHAHSAFPLLFPTPEYRG